MHAMLNYELVFFFFFEQWMRSLVCLHLALVCLLCTRFLVATERITKDSSKRPRKVRLCGRLANLLPPRRLALCSLATREAYFYHPPYENVHTGRPFLCTVLMKLLDAMHSRNSKILHTSKQK